MPIREVTYPRRSKGLTGLQLYPSVVLDVIVAPQIKLLLVIAM